MIPAWPHLFQSPPPATKSTVPVASPGDKSTVSASVIRRTENWLIRRGMPLLIADYSFSSHILPRMVPFLALVSATGLLWPLRVELSPVGRFVAVAAVLVGGVAAGILLNRFRRLPVFPRRAVILVLVTYGAMPVLIPLLDLAVSRTVASPDVGAGEITEGRTGFLWAVVGFAVIFVALFEAARLTTLYGILPLLARSVRNAWQDLRNTLRLQSRALPMLLFVTLFFFFTGELWQAMNRLTWWRLVLVLALFAGVTVLAAAGGCARRSDASSRTSAAEADGGVPRHPAGKGTGRRPGADPGRCIP